MSTLAMGFWQRHEHGMGRSFVLSAFVHVALAAVIFLGVRWQISPSEVVNVELVPEAPPPPPVEAPKPEPKVEPPKVEPPKVESKPEPKVEKPQIVIPDKPKPKPKPKAEVKPKPDPNFEKRLKEQVAMEQKALEQQRQERELRELIARKQAEAERAQAAARTKALNEYIGRIQGAIRQRIRESELVGISGNPAADFEVVQIPSGEVISIRMRKSSGYPRYDAEIERAIRAASPLPLPPPGSRELFSRELKLTFRPLDK